MKKIRFHRFGIGFVYLFSLSIVLVIAGVLLNNYWLLVLAIALFGFQWLLYAQFHRKDKTQRYYSYKIGRNRFDIQRFLLRDDSAGWRFTDRQREIIIKRSENIPINTALSDFQTLEFGDIEYEKNLIEVKNRNLRVAIGNEQCSKPFNLSILNAGAINPTIVDKALTLALSEGAKIRNFAVNTGGEGINPYLIRGGGDLIWQIGYNDNALRTENGFFNEVFFKINATRLYIKMIEVKLSDNDIPTTGRVHKMIFFLKKLRILSEGRPIGINLSDPKKEVFKMICKSMVSAGVYLDFITLEGENADINFARKTIDKYDLPVKVIASRVIVTEYDILHAIALGAHACYCTNSMIVASGGPGSWFKTPDPVKQRVGVANFHRNTIEATLKLMEVCGYKKLSEAKGNTCYRIGSKIYTDPSTSERPLHSGLINKEQGLLHNK